QVPAADAAPAEKRAVALESRGTARERELLAEVAALRGENGALRKDNAGLRKDLTESLERQTATSEVLGVISRSKFEIQPVLDTIAETAGKLCRTDSANIWRLVGDKFEIAASYRMDPSFAEFLRHNPAPLT